MNSFNSKIRFESNADSYSKILIIWLLFFPLQSYRFNLGLFFYSVLKEANSEKCAHQVLIKIDLNILCIFFVEPVAIKVNIQ